MASEVNTTCPPSPLIEGSLESPLPGAPLAPSARLARRVVAAEICRTNTSELALPSSATRFEAELWNATLSPSSLIEGSPEESFGRFPRMPSPRLTNVIGLVDIWPGSGTSRV